MNDPLPGNRPDWFYRLLPYFYAATGVLTMLVLRNGLAIFSGCLLITAAGLVWFMRRSTRETEAARNLPERSHPGLIDIVWRQSYNSGNRLIDGQHRSLFSAANRLSDAITTRQPAATVKEAIRALIQDIQTHFKTEEELLEKIAPALAGPHRALHSELIKEIGAILERVSHKTSALRELIGFVLVDVIANHLIEEDVKFFPLLKE